MPELSVSDAQLERLDAVREELEAAYVGEYGTVRRADALRYLLDTYTPPDSADGDASAAGVDLEALTAIDGVGEATAEALVDAGFPAVGRVAAAEPDALAEIKGVSAEQAADIAASAAAIEAGGSESGSDGQAGNGGASDNGGSGSDDSAAQDTPEDTLQQAMSLLDAHDDRWRESGGDEPYEVDLPDGSTTGVRTKDDIKRLVFKHWR